MQHPLELVDEAHSHGWDVLVDAGRVAPTNRFDVSATRPEFVAISFYKLFGFPTGVGCVLMRRTAASRLVRPWFAGGTVTVASVAGDGHHFTPEEARFEDGTVDYLNLAAVATGLDHLERVGLDAIHRRVRCLTSWLLATMATLHHRDGRPLVHVLGPADSVDRGGTIAFACSMTAPADASTVTSSRRWPIAPGSRCAAAASATPVQPRLPSACTPEQLRPWFARPGTVTYDELRDGLRTADGQMIGAVRASLGIASTFSDVHRLARLLGALLDRHAADLSGCVRQATR